jgi:hypothetical protein
MATVGLIDFTTAYKGGPSFYTGTGSTSLVPHVYPVAVDGRPYMVDQKSGRFGRAFEARVRESVDQNNLPGEATINPQGLWRRAQSSWHKGSGQQYADTADAGDYRFYTSKNLDPWTKGELKLLPTTSKVYNSSNSNVRICVADGRLYLSDGQTLKYKTDLSTYTTVTGTPAATINGLTTDGFNVWISFSGNGIYKTDTSTSAAASYATGHEWNQLQYVKGRLMAFGTTSSDSYKLWNITQSGNNPAILYTHPNTKFNWVGAAGGQQHIYVGGYAGGISLIYRTQIKADGTSLDVPIQAAELPQGEVIHALYGYLSYIVIGTSKGIRFCTSDTDGNLLVGPVLETTTSVYAASGDGRYIWYGWSNFDGTSTGLGRMDISELNGVNEPAYASDLMATTQGDVLGVANWNGGRVFSVSGQGLYAESTDLCATGYIETGTWRWGIPDRKFVPRFDTRTKPLAGSITTAFAFDGGSYTDLPAVDDVNSTDVTTVGPETGFSDLAIKLTFARSGTSNTAGPTLTRWQARGYAAPIRARVFSIPVLLHRKLRIRNSEIPMNVPEELAYLEGLVNDASIVSYQEAHASYNVVVENVEWIPLDSPNSTWEWEGTAVLTLRSIAD